MKSSRSRSMKEEERLAMAEVIAAFGRPLTDDEAAAFGMTATYANSELWGPTTIASKLPDVAA
jgi:hypothetical protein